MLKTLLAFCAVLALPASGLHADPARSFGGRGSFARPAAYRGGYYNHGGYGYRGYRGRYYYLGGIPYFYPFGFGYGFGYYGGFYGYGDGYGYGGYPYANGAYNGSLADANGNGGGQPPAGGQASGGSLPEAVQSQLARRGYYKGAMDGKFGPETKSALQRFQRKQGIKETGLIDEPTLAALGFTDHR